MREKQKVFVGLSGGVDSSVAALALLKSGYDVIGVFIKTWHPDFLQCSEEEERLDAMRVAATLNIPFLTCDAETEYKRDVADYMIREYREGRTPNPDIMCNRYVKFGAFLAFAKAHGADKIATGHHARVFERNGEFELLRGADKNKDQSYFLWTLTKHELSQTLFPIGHMNKDEVRKVAEKERLPTYSKPDSQGICFLGAVDVKEFLSHYIKPIPGDVLDRTGRKIGKHDGIVFYTVGQRHGFSITNVNTKAKPHYIVGKNIKQNTITVSNIRPKLETDTVNIGHTNWLIDIQQDEMFDAQFRYRQQPFHAILTSKTDGHAILTVDTNIDMPPEGQSCVLYQGDRCIGGGIIE
jgi:tRNA-specific 2-thiouridylase